MILFIIYKTLDNNAIMIISIVLLVLLKTLLRRECLSIYLCLLNNGNINYSVKIMNSYFFCLQIIKNHCYLTYVSYWNNK